MKTKGYKHTWETGSKFPTKHGGEITILSFKEGSYTHCYVECSICHKDKELFPEPLCVNKYKLKNGQQCCACGDTYKWKEWQYVIKVKRRCDEVVYTFRGWKGKFKGIDTRLDLVCNRGHEYSPSIDGFTSSRERLCKKCLGEDNSERFKLTFEQIKESAEEYEDNDHIFLGLVGEYKNSNSNVRFYCKKTESEVSCSVNSLRRSAKIVNLPCCSPIKEDKGGYFYLSFWGIFEDEAFIKYGITRKHPKERLKQQARGTKLQGRLLTSLKFDYISDAILLERYVKRLYKDRRKDKEDFNDGYTETLYYEHVSTEYDLYPDLTLLTGKCIFSGEDSPDKGEIKFKGDFTVESVNYLVNEGGTYAEYFEEED